MIKTNNKINLLFANIHIGQKSRDICSEGQLETTVRLLATNVRSKHRPTMKHSIGTIKTTPKCFAIVLNSYVEGIRLTYTIQEILNQLVDFHNSLIMDHGIKDGTKRYNTMRLYIINSLEGKSPENPPFMATSKKYKFPSKLYKMLDLYIHVIKNKCDKCDRVIRSLFYVNRLVKDNNTIDLSEITKEFKVSIQFKSDFRQFLRNWKEKVNYSRSPDLITEPTEKLVNSGPNGKAK